MTDLVVIQTMLDKVNIEYTLVVDVTDSADGEAQLSIEDGGSGVVLVFKRDGSLKCIAAYEVEGG